MTSNVERLRYERWLKITKAGLTHTKMWNNRHGNNLDPATLSQEQFDCFFTESLGNHKERSEVRRQLEMANKLVANLIAKHPDAINSFTFSCLLEHRIPHGHLTSRVLGIPEKKCARRIRKEIMTTARDLIEKKKKHVAYLESLNEQQEDNTTNTKGATQ